jgi:hypothetical protein
MKRLALLFAALLLLAPAAWAQSRYYYSDERKIPIERAESGAVVQIPETARTALTDALSRQPGVRLRSALDRERGFYWLEANERQPLSAATINELSSRVPIQRAVPAFYHVRERDTTYMLMTDAFRAKFRSGVSRAEIDAFNETHGVEVALDNEIDRWQAREYDEYLLRVSEASGLNALEAANRYYESDLTVWSVPNLFVDVRPYNSGQHAQNRPASHARQQSANDPLYDEQYYLNNTSNNLGTPDVDIDAPDAWNQTKGSSDVTVAVIDAGVEQHEDFYSGQLVSGFTPGPEGSEGSPTNNNAYHGQAVAGIIGANHNSTGARGVAPSVKIMPINIFKDPQDPVDPNEIENAIHHAWQNGADVVNNSWGRDNFDDGIAAAIDSARQKGRDGKGAVVVSSAGNRGDTKDVVTFPGTLPGVLTVGAVTKEGNRAGYSPVDEDVDLVAPSGDFDISDVRTMDREGSSGKEPDASTCDDLTEANEPENYYGCFNGTSAAAPQASGVAALMLSANPNLDEGQVRNKIKNTADDEYDGDWAGNGRINAAKAVEAAPPPLSVNLIGPSSRNSGQEGTWTASVSGGAGSISYDWEYQPACPDSRKSPNRYCGWSPKNCSGPDCSHTFFNNTDETMDGGIRVTASSNIQTETDSKTVTVSPGGGSSSTTASGGSFGTPAQRHSPVLRDLDAQSSSKETVTLTWRALGSSLPARFVVEHRTDTTGAWSKRGTVAASDSASVDPTGTVAYHFEAENLGVGTHQLRLAYEATEQGKSVRRATEAITATVELEDAYRLRAYPNPVRERATVELAVKEAQPVTVAIYDVLGRRVATLHAGPLPAQELRRLRLDAPATGLTSGQYFLRVTGEQFAATRRMTVVR